MTNPRIVAYDQVVKARLEREDRPFRIATPQELEQLQTWLPPNYRDPPPCSFHGPDMVCSDCHQLRGFRYGEDLFAYPSHGMWAWAFADMRLAYNAAVCSRGLNRWEDDGGR